MARRSLLSLTRADAAPQQVYSYPSHLQIGTNWTLAAGDTLVFTANEQPIAGYVSRGLWARPADSASILLTLDGDLQVGSVASSESVGVILQHEILYAATSSLVLNGRIDIRTGLSGQGATAIYSDNTPGRVGQQLIVNNGTIDVYNSSSNGPGRTATGIVGRDVINTGTIEVRSDSGTAYGVQLHGLGSLLNNSGEIRISGGIADNPLGAVAVRAMGAVATTIENSGTISATSTASTVQSIGIYLFPNNTNIYQAGTLRNSGTINAEVAIYATEGYGVALTIVNSGLITGGLRRDTGGLDVVTNASGATWIGELTFGRFPDIFRNAGTLTGSATLGVTADYFDGSGGTVSGTIDGGGGHDFLRGGNGLDRLVGDSGADLIIGSGGGDILTGGSGADVFRYVISSDSDVGAEDTITDFETGIDRIDLSALAPVSFTLTASAGQTIVAGSGLGGDFRILVDGSVAAGDIVTTVVGAIQQGSDNGELLLAGDFDSDLFGNGGDDTLVGGAGSDWLDGGSGANVLIGGLGDDFYIINSGNEFVIEAENAGEDVVLSFVDYSLQAWVEHGELIGTNQAGLLGNELNNWLIGNDGANSLTGMGGDDTLVGGSGADMLSGGAGNDLLDGGAGSDQMSGGQGDDVFIVDRLQDVVQEYRLDGYDEVRASVSGYILPQYVERLVYTGVGPGLLLGDGRDDDLVGGASGDLFRLEVGGADRAFGGAGDDGFYFGAAMDSADTVDGGTGSDQLALHGNYAGLTFNSLGLVNVEMVVLLAGDDTRFANLGGANLSYNLTTIDANIGAGQLLTFQANTLRAGENFSLNAAAETSGSVLVFGGAGIETLTGGQADDGFYFGTGRFNPGDTLNGEGGSDQLGLQGDYAGANALTFGANQLTGIEFLVLMSASDTRFGGGNTGQSFSYALTTHDGNVAAGQTLIVSSNSLGATEVLTFDGSAEQNGSFRIFSGAGADILAGGGQADEIWGGAGADIMRGGLGDDRFAYSSVSGSSAAAYDQVLDFASGDRIDLSSLDANVSAVGRQGFELIASGMAFTAAGQLRISQTGTAALVEGDSDGDGGADFVVAVTVIDGHALTGSDFLGLVVSQENLKSAEAAWVSSYDTYADLGTAMTWDLQLV